MSNAAYRLATYGFRRLRIAASRALSAVTLWSASCCSRSSLQMLRKVHVRCQKG